DDHRMSNTLMNQMLPHSGPRIPVYAQPTVANPAVYAGMPNALTQAGASAYFTISSRPGAVFYGATVYSCPTCGARTGATFPSFVMTYAEVSFILAEAAERGWVTTAGTEAALYNQGIQASMDQWGVTVAAAVARQGPDVFSTRMYWDNNPTVAPTYPGATCGTR